MATHIGNEGTVKIGANTLAEIRSWRVNETAAVADDSALGDEWDSHLVGSKSWSAEVTCMLDETDTTGQGALSIGASVTLNLYPEGADSGDTYKTGTATVTGASRQGSRNNVIEVSFTCQGNGALTEATV